MLKDKKEKFEYFQLYADVEKLPVGVVHKANLKEGGETPEEIGQRVLSKYGMSNFTAVAKSEDEQKYKLTGWTTDFYSDRCSWIDIRMVSDKWPSIVLWQDAANGSKAKGRGIAFNDEETFEIFVQKVNQAYLIYKGRGK